MKKYTTLTASCCILRMIVPNKTVGHFKSSHDPHPLVVWTLGAPVTDWALVAPKSVLPPRASSDPFLRTIPPLHPSDPIPLRINLNLWIGAVSLGSQPIAVYTQSSIYWNGGLALLRVIYFCEPCAHVPASPTETVIMTVPLSGVHILRR